MRLHKICSWTFREWQKVRHHLPQCWADTYTHCVTLSSDRLGQKCGSNFSKSPKLIRIWIWKTIRSTNEIRIRGSGTLPRISFSSIKWDPFQAIEYQVLPLSIKQLLISTNMLYKLVMTVLIAFAGLNVVVAGPVAPSYTCPSGRTKYCCTLTNHLSSEDTWANW